jgi:hypothetical protein
MEVVIVVVEAMVVEVEINWFCRSQSLLCLCSNVSNGKRRLASLVERYSYSSHYKDHPDYDCDESGIMHNRNQLGHQPRYDRLCV